MSVQNLVILGKTVAELFDSLSGRTCYAHIFCSETTIKAREVQAKPVYDRTTAFVSVLRK